MRKKSRSHFALSAVEMVVELDGVVVEDVTV
jgi:hypothetical protein